MGAAKSKNRPGRQAKRGRARACECSAHGGHHVSPSKQADLPSAAHGAPAGVGRVEAVRSVDGRVPPDERVDFIPRLAGRPWTAPAYDELRTVVRLPVITGALCVNDSCVCYNGRERLLEVASEHCREWAVNRPFNPYVADSSPDKAVGNSASSQPQTALVPSQI